MLMDNSQVVRPEPDARRATGGRLTWTERSSTRPPTASTACRLPPRPPRQDTWSWRRCNRPPSRPTGLTWLTVKPSWRKEGGVWPAESPVDSDRDQGGRV